MSRSPQTDPDEPPPGGPEPAGTTGADGCGEAGRGPFTGPEPLCPAVADESKSAAVAASPARPTFAGACVEVCEPTTPIGAGMGGVAEWPEAVVGGVTPANAVVEVSGETSPFVGARVAVLSFAGAQVG